MPDHYGHSKTKKNHSGARKYSRAIRKSALKTPSGKQITKDEYMSQFNKPGSDNWDYSGLKKTMLKQKKK